MSEGFRPVLGGPFAVPCGPRPFLGCIFHPGRGRLCAIALGELTRSGGAGQQFRPGDRTPAPGPEVVEVEGVELHVPEIGSAVTGASRCVGRSSPCLAGLGRLHVLSRTPNR